MDIDLAAGDMDIQKSLKDLLAGLVFIGFGLAFGIASLGYDLGTALRMGPGYFPLILAGILVVLGIATVIKAVLDPETSPLGPLPWKGILLLTAALFIFGFTVRPLGLVPSVLIAVFLSAFASERNGLVRAAVLAVGLTAFCIVVFVYALGLPLPLFGPRMEFLGLS